MNIDFSTFKKIDSNDKHTILRHPNGHDIKISHKGLSPKYKKELDELPMHLAKGGFTKFSQKYDPNVKKKSSSPSDPTSVKGDPSYAAPKEAKNAFTEPDNMGTQIPKQVLAQELHDKHYPVVVEALNRKAPPFGPLGSDPKYHSTPCINPSCKSFGQSHPNCRCYGGKMGTHGGYAKGGEVNNFCSQKKPHQPDCQYFKEGGMAEDDPESAPPQDQPHTLAEIPSQPGAQQELNGDTPNPEMSSQQEPVTYTPPEPGSEIDTEISNAEQAAAATPVQQFQDHKDNDLQDMTTESQAFNQDLNNGHIKPETYHDLFAKKDTLGKIGTMFGLLLSGAGAGLTHQPNMLLEMMNKQIDNDLRGQEVSAANRQNFLRINQDNLVKKAQAGQMNVDTKTKAYALAKVQMNYAALHKLVTDTDKLPPGPQKDQAMQTLAMMNQGVQNENFNILDRAASGAAFYKTLFGNQQGAPQEEQQFQNKVSGLKALGPQGESRAKDMEEKHYPGVPGLASMPLNNEDRNQIHSGIAFDRALNSFRDWAKKHSGDLNPSERNYGQSLAADLQGAYRQATHGGVYKEGEQNFISTVIDSNPTKFFNSIRVLPKLDAAADQNKMRLDQILKDKGFNGYPGMKGASKAPAHIERFDPKTGKTALYDSETKKPIGWK